MLEEILFRHTYVPRLPLLKHERNKWLSHISVMEEFDCWLVFSIPFAFFIPLRIKCGNLGNGEELTKKMKIFFSGCFQVKGKGAGCHLLLLMNQDTLPTAVQQGTTGWATCTPWVWINKNEASGLCSLSAWVTAADDGAGACSICCVHGRKGPPSQELKLPAPLLTGCELLRSQWKRQFHPSAGAPAEDCQRTSIEFKRHTPGCLVILSNPSANMYVCTKKRVRGRPSTLVVL